MLLLARYDNLLPSKSLEINRNNYYGFHLSHRLIKLMDVDWGARNDRMTDERFLFVLKANAGFYIMVKV